MDYDSRDMLISSDFPLDKIIYMDSGYIDVPSGSAVYTVAHGLSFRPLIIASWSLDSDFSTTKEVGFPLYGDFSQPYFEINSDYQNIRLIPNNPTGSTIRMYWRAFGFMPPNVNDIAPFTASEADNFVLNTDYNYTKLLNAGVVDLSSGSVSISHSLGYRPQVDVWSEFANDSSIVGREYLGTSSLDSFSNRISVSNTALNFTKGTGPSPKTIYYYRIYTDEQ